MIYYDNRSWLGLVFRFTGTIWESTWHLTVMIMLISALVFFGELYIDQSIGDAGHTIFGSTMSYLLVFRANTASVRYWEGKTLLTDTFFQMRHMIMMMCVAMKGGAACEAWREHREQQRANLEDVNDIKASMARVNCVRLVLAYVVALKLHTRIAESGYIQGSINAQQKRMVDMDRIRLRGLMTRQEFEHLSGLVPIFNDLNITEGAIHLTPHTIEKALEQPLADEYEVDITPDMRQPLAILMFIRLEITKHMNEPYGFRDRFAKDMMSVCDALSTLFEKITMVITTPIPFPYVHLCKMMLLCFLVSLPFVMKVSTGFFASVCVPGCIAMSLLGIDAIATELAEPFGDDKNDLDVTGLIGVLEDECMKFLDLCGDTRSLEAFRSYEIPEVLILDDPRSPTEFLCLCSQVDFGAVEEATNGNDLEVGGARCSLIVPKRPKKSVFYMPGAATPGLGLQAHRLPGAARQLPQTPMPPTPMNKRQKDKSPARVQDRSISFGEDDPRQPLLAMSGEHSGSQAFRPMDNSMGSSAVVFCPMEDIGSAETVDLEEEEDTGHQATDCVGLSDNEFDDEQEEGGKGFRPMSNDLRGSASPRVGQSGRSDREKRRKKGFQPLKVGSATGSMVGSARFRDLPEDAKASQSARGGFRPMEEMGTQTIHFSEAELGDEGGPDVVGLSDDEDDELDLADVVEGEDEEDNCSGIGR